MGWKGVKATASIVDYFSMGGYGRSVIFILFSMMVSGTGGWAADDDCSLQLQGPPGTVLRYLLDRPRSFAIKLGPEPIKPFFWFNIAAGDKQTKVSASAFIDPAEGIPSPRALRPLLASPDTSISDILKTADDIAAYATELARLSAATTAALNHRLDTYTKLLAAGITLKHYATFSDSPEESFFETKPSPELGFKLAKRHDDLLGMDVVTLAFDISPHLPAAYSGLRVSMEMIQPPISGDSGNQISPIAVFNMMVLNAYENEKMATGALLLILNQAPKTIYEFVIRQNLTVRELSRRLSLKIRDMIRTGEPEENIRAEIEGILGLYFSGR